MSHPRANVFIIDNEASIRTALERLIRSAGHTGRSFESVEEFLAATVDDHNACVVTDIHLRGASGLTLPERLRELNRNIPVIFITAYDSPEHRSQARRVGGAGYFRKPVDDQALLDAIEWSLSTPSPGPPTERQSSSIDSAPPRNEPNQPESSPMRSQQTP